MWHHIETPAQAAAIWKDQKEKLKVKFPGLTEEDLNYDESRRDEMMSNLQVKLAQTKVQLNATVSWY
jgi:hypothetical protein